MFDVENLSIELLSPAKNIEAGKAAVDYGADAVYIGGPGFGARQAAANSLEDIGRLVNYAHLFRVKVYVALNTLLFDSELESVEKLIWSLFELKVDALIIQDLGILELDLPSIPLFASTQMANLTSAKVRFLQDLGFQRVILERALSLQEIRLIREASTVELECFVQGAICVCYSGMCSLSTCIAKSARSRGTHSANRGECAQPCRKLYSLVDASGNNLGDNFWLSVKDLNLSQYLRDLIDAGVTSFKIEGRLKDLAYVKNVTAYYRQELDPVLNSRGLDKNSSGSCSYDFAPDLAKTFNRGYTDYYISETPKSLLAGSSASIGEYIGKVTACSEHSLEIDTKVELSAGDGCCYLQINGEMSGFYINNVHGKGIIEADNLNKLEVGVEIYRNYDYKFQKELKNSKTKRNIVVNWQLNEYKSAIELIVKDEDHNTCSKQLSVADVIQNLSNDYEDRLSEVLLQLGNTNFRAVSISLNLTKQHFIPLSQLKKLRNEVLDELVTKRLANYEQEWTARTQAAAKSRSDKLIYDIEPSMTDGPRHILNRKAASFHEKQGLAGDINAVEGLSEIPEDLPLMTTRYCILKELDRCLLSKQKLETPLFLQNNKDRFQLEFDCQRCEMTVKLAK